MSAFCHSDWCFKGQRGMRTAEHYMISLILAILPKNFFGSPNILTDYSTPIERNHRTDVCWCWQSTNQNLDCPSLASALSAVVDLIYSRQLDPKLPFPGHKIFSVTLLYTLLG